MTKNITTLIKELSAQLEARCAHKQAATQQAWWMLEKATGKSMTELLTHPEQTLSTTQQQALDDMLKLRIEHKKPLQYILGSVPFCGIEIMVEAPILIPRPETEEWVSWLIHELEPVKNKPLKILDLCTGSGCIALALAHALPQATVTGIDINPQAIALANKNKRAIGTNNITFIQSDMLTSLPPSSTFDIIVSNPPYITAEEHAQLEKDVSAWEDYAALVAPDEGLAFYKHIAQQARTHLIKQNTAAHFTVPRIVVEIGSKQSNVVSIFQQAGFSDVRLNHDMHGNPRWIAAYI